jgi:GDPmannose 4,6-dehydratase
LGNPEKAKTKLKWETKTSLEELVRLMVRYDLEHDDYGGKE